MDVDLAENRLEVARELGADHTIKVSTSATAQQLAKEVERELGEKPDVSIECSGAEPSIKLAILVCMVQL